MPPTTIHEETVLSCTADQAWRLVRTSALLRHVAWPLVTFTPVDPRTFPATWPPGGTIRLRSRAFGVIPLGVRSLHFALIDDHTREIHTREHDRLFRRWDHRIAVQPLDSAQSRYVDDVTIDAGRLTPLLRPLVTVFYRHRQRRWKRLAAHRRLERHADS